MSSTILATSRAGGALSSTVSRTLLGVTIAASAAVGFALTSPDLAGHAAIEAGADLTRLLRAMAAIKLLMAAVATAAIFWRLGSAITLPWFAAYALAGGAMAAGPGLIWDMEYVRSGAALLHGGLLAAVLLVWRDRIVGARLAALVAARRARR